MCCARAVSAEILTSVTPEQWTVDMEQHLCTELESGRSVLEMVWFSSSSISWLLARHMLLQGAQIIYVAFIALY